MHDYLFISSNWWIDGEEAYFVTAWTGMLFRVDLNTCQCEFIAIVPKSNLIKCRANAYCRKYKDKVYYFPYKQGIISCYDLKKSIWEEVLVGYEGDLMICIEPCRSEDGTLWLLEQRGNRIFQINLDNAKIEQEYTTQNNTNMVNGQYVLVNNELYYIAGSGVGCIDIEHHTSIRYSIEGIDFQLFTICYDGQNFWISGEYEIIYIWSPVRGVVKRIKNILSKYILLDFEKKMVLPNVPLFSYSIFLGKYVWYVPIQINAPIIYIHKENYTVHIMEMEKEKETEKTLKDRGNACKYKVQYVRQKKYIGLYSVKNRRIFEIDTENIQVKEIKYEFNDRTQYMIADAYYREKNVLCEDAGMDQNIFEILLRKDINEKKTNIGNRGKDIYTALTEKKL